MSIAPKANDALRAALLCAALALAGCNRLVPDPELENKRQDDEAAATGAACRQAGRSIEECFSKHEGVGRAGALRGWREMDDYMRQNKLDPQKPAEPKPDAEPASAGAASEPKAQEAVREAKPGREPQEPKPAGAPR